MPAKIITIAQQKGGAGKTTLAAHLAVAFAQNGSRVALLDIDPQGSLARFGQLRAHYKQAVPLAFHSLAGWRTEREIEKLAHDYDLIVIDSPPHAATEPRLAIRAADLVLVPVQPSPMDVWACEPTIDLCVAEQTAHMLVLNRMPSAGKLAKEMTDELAKLNVPLAKAALGNRVAYAAAMARGLGITEFEKRGNAAQELVALALESLQMLALSGQGASSQVARKIA